MAVCECLALYPTHVGPDRFPRGSRCDLFSGLRPESCRPVTGPYRVHGPNWIGGPGLDSNKLGPSLPPQVAQPGLAYSSRWYIELPQIVSVVRLVGTFHCSFSIFHLPHQIHECCFMNRTWSCSFFVPSCRTKNRAWVFSKICLLTGSSSPSYISIGVVIPLFLFLIPSLLHCRLLPYALHENWGCHTCTPPTTLNHCRLLKVIDRARASCFDVTGCAIEHRFTEYGTSARHRL